MSEENSKTIDLGDMSNFTEDFTKAFNKFYTTPIKRIYIDLPYIQDIYLGALLQLIKTKEDYKYIINNLGPYNHRLKEDILFYFPKLKIEKEELDNYIKNEENAFKLLSFSPYTNMFQNLKLLHSNIDKINNVVADMRAYPSITYTINTYPLVLSLKLKKFLKYRFSYIANNIIFGTMCKPISIIDQDEFVGNDLFLIFNVDNFVSEHSNHLDYFYKQLKYSQKYICSPKRIYNQELLDDINYLTKEQIEKCMILTESLLSTCSEFTYLDPTILMLKS